MPIFLVVDGSPGLRVDFLIMRRLLYLSLLLLAFGIPVFCETGIEDDRNRVFESINTIRKTNRLTSLSRDVYAQISAQSHAEELALRLSLSHRGTDGYRVSDRYRIAGGTAMSAGENLGAGDTIDQIIRAWMDSPGHRENLLNPDWWKAGVGIHILDSGRLIIVMVFTSSRWELKNIVLEVGEVSITSELLVNSSSFPQNVFLRVEGINYSPNSVQKQGRTALNLNFKVPIPYYWYLQRDTAFQIAIVESGKETISDMIVIPPLDGVHLHP